MRAPALTLLSFMLAINACSCDPDPLPSAPADAGAGDGSSHEDATTLDADAHLADVATSSDAGSISDAGIDDAMTSSASDGSIDDGSTEDASDDASTDAGIAADAANADATIPNTDAGGPCTATIDCIPGVEACGDILSVNNTIETHCTPINTNGAAVGGFCTTDAQCHDGLCLSGVAGECSVVCADAARDCPAGFSCTGYRYNPGNVWVGLCSRACADNDDCAAGTPGNFCSTQVHERNAMWFVDRVCQAPPGSGALGAQCQSGNDCQAGVCLTTSRNTSCMTNGDCLFDESCEMAACVSRLCTNLCDDASDCAAPNQSLTMCDPGIRLGLPDGTDALISACARM